MKTGIAGISLIKESEGFSYTAYQKKGDVWTIGWGNIYIDGRPVREGDVIDMSKAMDMLDEGLLKREVQLNRMLKVALNQNQYDACMDLFWEIGAGDFQDSTLLRLINQNPSDTKIADAFKMWVKGRDVDGALITLPGMVTRRQKEVNLYFKTL